MLWIWIQNLWFGSGTREKPSGYTTHEITIFKYKMGDFFFWPKNGVSAIKVSLWYFRILSRFYLFNLCCWFFIMGDNFQWTGGSHLGHSSHSAAFWWFRFSSSFKICQEACHCRIFANSLGPFSDFCLKITALFFHFNQRPFSLYCVWKSWINQEVRLHSSFVEDEDGDLISPVQMSVEFTTSFP